MIEALSWQWERTGQGSDRVHQTPCRSVAKPSPNPLSQVQSKGPYSTVGPPQDRKEAEPSKLANHSPKAATLHSMSQLAGKLSGQNWTRADPGMEK